jgi:hypothetical protein
VKLRLAFCMAAFLATLTPALAQDSLSGLAPADEYFGHYKMSVLGIANTIRDAGARMDSGSDPSTMLSGPLSYVTDAIKDWEAQYPADPWIAKDLMALEDVYLRVPTDDGFKLASQTEAWLSADFPDSEYAAKGRSELAMNRVPYMPQQLASQPAPQAPAPPQPVWQPLPPMQPLPQTWQQPRQQAIPSYAMSWERFAALRGQYYPH